MLVRASAEQRMSLSTIRTLQLPLPNGRTVPLTQIASIDYGQEYPIVWRRDRRPTVTVQADVAPGTQAATVVQTLTPKTAALNASLPSGYHIGIGGTVEESNKAQVSVAAALHAVLPLLLAMHVKPLTPMVGFRCASPPAKSESKREPAGATAG